jgi:sugar/nucleoside kinase (ribokinase family)
MNHDICCIGHITLDKVIMPANTVYMPGGTAYYFSHAVANLAIKYVLVTAIADNELSSVTSLEKKGIEVKRLPSAHTVFFENRYGHNQDQRTQKVLQEADPFQPGQLSDLKASIFHLGPLLANDIPDEAIEALAAKGKVSLDVQGLLRKVEAQNVVAINWQTKKEVLPFIHFVKASEEEMKMLTGDSDITGGAKKIVEWGAKEVIITLGSKGSVVYNEDKFYHIPAYKPIRVTDATGCGDTYMAGYLYQRVKGAGIQQAGEFAAAMSTAKIASSGPFTGTEDEVENVVKQDRRVLASF